MDGLALIRHWSGIESATDPVINPAAAGWISMQAARSSRGSRPGSAPWVRHLSWCRVNGGSLPQRRHQPRSDAGSAARAAAAGASLKTKEPPPQQLLPDHCFGTLHLEVLGQCCIGKVPKLKRSRISVSTSPTTASPSRSRRCASRPPSIKGSGAGC